MKDRCKCSLIKDKLQVQTRKAGDMIATRIRRSAQQHLAQSDPNGNRPDWLCNARRFIHEHYLEPISLYDVAHAAAVHPAHLARSYRRHYRITVGDYIRSLRLQFAANKLANSDDPILEIALSSGFYDQSHFTNEFKARTGITPGAYRRNFRNV